MHMFIVARPAAHTTSCSFALSSPSSARSARSTRSLIVSLIEERERERDADTEILYGTAYHLQMLIHVRY